MITKEKCVAREHDADKLENLSEVAFKDNIRII